MTRQGSHWWEYDSGETDELPPETVVSQCGKVAKLGMRARFNERPRFNREFALSVIEGRHNSETAVRLAFGRPLAPGDTVRYFVVGKLQANGYWVYSYPTNSNPRHGRISAPVHSTDVDRHKAWWARPDRVTLEALTDGQEAR